MVTEELGTFLQYGSSYNWCPGSPVSEQGVTGIWTVPRLPLTPQETQTPASEAAESPPAWCSFHAWETSGWEANPLQLSDSTCIVSLDAQSIPSLRGAYALHHHLSLSARGAITFQPGTNRHTWDDRQTQCLWYTAAPSYPGTLLPPHTQLWLSLWALMQPGAWWEKHRHLQTLRVPLLLSLNTCSFKGEWRNLGKSLSPTSNSSDKKPLQNETEM